LPHLRHGRCAAALRRTTRSRQPRALQHARGCRCNQRFQAEVKWRAGTERSANALALPLPTWRWSSEPSLNSLRALRRLESLVGQTLLSVQVRAGLEPSRKRLNLATVLQQLEQDAVRERGISIRIEADESVELDADEQLLLSAMSNLLQNASSSRPQAVVSSCAVGAREWTSSWRLKTTVAVCRRGRRRSCFDPG
jgi:signal transduction histidine kinase